MSGTTFSTYPVQSQSATHAAPRSGAAQSASVEQSYLAASAQYATPAPTAAPAASYDPGPGLTTLAIGEEDGGMATMPPSMPPSDMMSTPHQGGDGGFQVTTLAIGEEDGGAVGGGYGTMSPIRDDHSTIGGSVGSSVGSSVDTYGASPAQGIQQDGYGGMQPIYSPGEAEYPAFAQTSQTTDLLNFHPVARVPKVALPQSMPVAAPAPIAVTAPATAQPIYAAPTPVGTLAQDVPQSGSYESVGSYEDYVGGTTAAPTYAPVQQPMGAAPSAPAYEAFEPSYESIDVPQSVPAHTPAPAPVPAPTPAYEVAPAPYEPATVAPEPAPAYEAAPVQDIGTALPAAPDAMPAATYAPMTSMEPREKPSLFGKDTPFDGAGSVQAPDPADGNPDYVAPADTATEAPAPDAAADATYVEVSIDDYLLDASGTQGTAAPAAPMAPAEAAPATAATSSPAPEAPAAMPSTAPAGEPASQPRSSLGGSYVVIDDVPPGSTAGSASGAGAGRPEVTPEAAPGTSDEDLRIITLSTGEEAGSQ